MTFYETLGSTPIGRLIIHIIKHYEVKKATLGSILGCCQLQAEEVHVGATGLEVF
jgi:hypothetical protein